MKRLALVSLLAIASAQASAQSEGPAGAMAPGLSAGDPAQVGGATGSVALLFHDVSPTTSIIPDTDAALSFGTQVSQSGNVYTIDGGRLAGTNLFHSLAHFDLGAGDVASWQFSAGDPATLSNVINRVTGGNPSHIFGTIDSSAIPNADFWFVNPAGIIFGAGAVIDVPAAAHFSTASELRFASGPSLAVAAPDGSTLSVANPSAFGFFGNEGIILLSDLDNSFTPNLGALSLTASDVGIFDSQLFTGSLAIAATGGVAAQITPTGTASAPLAGEVLASGAFVLTQASPFASGDLTVTAGALTMEAGSALAVGAGFGVDGGTLFVDAGQIDLSDSGLATFTSGPEAAGNILVAADDITLDASIIQSTSTGTGQVGSVRVSASGTLDMSNVSTIAADSFGDADSGGVEISAGALTLSGGSYISSDALANGRAGGVLVVVENQLALSGGAYISSDSFGSGNAGSVTVTAGNALLTDGSFISSDALDNGNGGNVLVSVDNDLVLLESYISSDTLGSGLAGDVAVEAGYIGLAGSYISSDAVGSGTAGNVTVRASTADLLEGSYISSDIYDVGQAGTVDVDILGTLSLDSGSAIRSNVGSEGNRDASGPAGDVLVTATEILLTDGSYIASDVWGDGSGGTVSVGTDYLLLTGRSYISSDSLGLGDGGAVQVFATNADLVDSYIASDVYGEGSGGNVLVDIADNLYLQNGIISSEVFGVGDAGNVTIRAGSAQLLLGSYIASDIYNVGLAGTVDVDVVGALALDGGSAIRSNVGTENDQGASGLAGDVLVTAGEILLAGGSFIASDVWGEGSGGTVAVATDFLSLEDGSYISSDSLNVGNGGDVRVFAGDAHLSGGSYISSDVYGDGDAGAVSVEIGGALQLLSGATIRSVVQSGAIGQGGDVFVSADTLSLDGQSAINSDALGFGDAGFVSVSANQLTLAGASYISSDSVSFGDGGDVAVSAGNATLTGDSYISSDALSEGDGGNVLVEVGNDLAMTDSAISSDSLGSGNAGGAIVTAGGDARLVNSRISSDAVGDGQGGVAFVAVTDLLTLDASSISSDSFGAGDAGGVLVEAGDATLLSGSYISSDALGDGMGGLVSVDIADELRLRGESYISSDVGGTGDAGIVQVTAPRLDLAEGSYISSDTLPGSTGNAQSVTVRSSQLAMASESYISSNALGDGNAGFVDVDASRSLALTGGAVISSSTSGAGDAGLVLVTGGEASLEDSFILANAFASGDAQAISIVLDSLRLVRSEIESEAKGSGASGTIEIDTGALEVLEGSAISTRSFNPLPAGSISIAADRLLIDGPESTITSENFSAAAGNAGEIVIVTGGATLSEGGRVTTNSVAGEAGNITFQMPSDGILILEGRNASGTIETSSGPGRGGKIFIQSPLAIISNGGNILALGESGGANVIIDTPYFIASADRVNRVEVDGVLTFSNAIYDVSAGIVNPDLSVLDASGVLRGQCPAVRATGEVSELIVRESGPFTPLPADTTRSPERDDLPGPTAARSTGTGECS